MNTFISVSSNYTVLVSDYIVNQGGSNTTVTLPNPAGIESKQFIIKNTSIGTVTLVVTGGVLMDNQTTVFLNPYESISVVSTGTKYLIY